MKRDSLLVGADHPTVVKVVELAAPITADTGVSISAMVGTSRTTRVALARRRLFAALWLAGFSHSEIGRLFRRDHTSVLASVRKTVGLEAYRAALRERTAARAAS